MAESLKIRVRDLLPELAAHTFVFFRALQTARAVAACSFQPLFNRFHRFFIGIQFNRQKITTFVDLFFIALEKFFGAREFRRIKHLLRRALFQDHTAVHKDDPIGNIVRK